jgi:glutamate synthase domain-containing protein 2
LYGVHVVWSPLDDRKWSLLCAADAALSSFVQPGPATGSYHEYDEYSMRGFREHVYQEVKYQKFVNYLSDKREKDEQEKRAVLDKWKNERPTIKAQQEQFTAEKEADNNGKRLRTG